MRMRDLCKNWIEWISPCSVNAFIPSLPAKNVDHQRPSSSSLSPLLPLLQYTLTIHFGQRDACSRRTMHLAALILMVLVAAVGTQARPQGMAWQISNIPPGQLNEIFSGGGGGHRPKTGRTSCTNSSEILPPANSTQPFIPPLMRIESEDCVARMSDQDGWGNLTCGGLAWYRGRSRWTSWADCWSALAAPLTELADYESAECWNTVDLAKCWVGFVPAE